MPGDAYKKVRAGQPLELPAETFNSFIDAAVAHKRRQHVASEFGNAFRQATIIRVKNESGSDQPRFACLGIDGPIILPSDNQIEFSNGVALRCGTPTADDHADGRFVILLEPLKAGTIGLAFAAGVCPAKLLVEDGEADGYRFAGIKEGSTTLVPKRSGPAAILWKEIVTPGPGVEAWAVIRLAGGGHPVRRFEMKDSVEEKAWDFDVKGQAYFLVWDDTLGDWKHEDGDPTAEVWGDRFLHGVAFGDDGQAGAGDRVTCWFDEASDKWWIIEGGQTFIVAGVTQESGIPQGTDGTATISTADARAIQVTVKASIMDLTDQPSLCYCWWDDAGGGHWDGLQPGGNPGCGLKKDSAGKLAFDPAAVAGYGLEADTGAGEDCKLDVDLSLIAGCGLVLPSPPTPPVLNVFNVDLAGRGLVPGSGACDLDVNVGCGLKLDADAVEVDHNDLVGRGLLVGLNDCDLDVDLGCGLEFDGNAIHVRPQDLAGAGLAGDLVQPGECFLQVDFGTNCGLAFDVNDQLVLDLTTLAGPGLTEWTNPWGCVGLQVDCPWIEENCGFLAGTLGCGLFQDAAGVIQVDNDDLAGRGLAIGGGACDVDVALGCGLQLDALDQVAVNPSDLAGDGLTTGGAACDLEVAPGCGIAVDSGGVSVDRTALIGQGLQPGAGACDIEVALGCGLDFDEGGGVEVNPDDLAGDGLSPGTTDCRLDVNVGCGLEIAGDAVAVDPDDLASDDVQPTGTGCALRTDGFTGSKQVVTAIQCDPYDPYACPVAVVETWQFQNGLLKSVT